MVTSSQSILESIFAIWALHRFGFGPRTAGLFMFFLAIFAVLTQGVLVRVLAPKLGEKQLAMWGIAAYVVGLAVVSHAPNITITAIALALCGIGTGAFNPSASALASKQSDEHDRGAVLGTYQSSSSLARVIGPFLSGPVYEVLGPSAPFVLGACVALPAAWFISRVRKPTA